MSRSKVLLPKRPLNLIVMMVSSLAFVAVYGLAAQGGWPWSPKRGVGLVFGMIATLLFVFETVYPFRRPRAWPLRDAQQWVQGHVYLGLLALLAVLIHTGFALPHGWMGWL